MKMFVAGGGDGVKAESREASFSRLAGRLATALGKETVWRPRLYTQPESGMEGRVVCSRTRDEMVHWLVKLTDQHKFHPETFALSVVLLDHFLNIVKASPRYIKVITLTCFFLAAKIQEEDEVVPSTLDLVGSTGSVCSVPELLRMERLVLDKLQWNLGHVTHLDFLHIFHSLLLVTQPELLSSYSHMTPGHQLSALTAKLKLCLTHHQLSAVRPAVLSLSLLSLELEWYTSDWLAHTVMLQRMARIDCDGVVRCRELISACLSDCRYKNIVYRYSPEAVNKRAKRKVSESDDDVYDGIKRLYNELPQDETSDESQARVVAKPAPRTLAITAAPRAFPPVSTTRALVQPPRTYAQAARTHGQTCAQHLHTPSLERPSLTLVEAT